MNIEPHEMEQPEVTSYHGSEFVAVTVFTGMTSS